ncbi:MAG: hypothetical protein IPJ39_17735 [Saprospiraceae bacterium]|nr:hypothetical protein [Saprospiraceae bacterium]
MLSQGSQLAGVRRDNIPGLRRKDFATVPPDNVLDAINRKQGKKKKS